MDQFDGRIQQMSQQEVRLRCYDCLHCQVRAENPVITPCGHLYCWRCLFQNLRTTLKCPHCQMHCDSQDPYPIFVESTTSPDDIPARPACIRKGRILNPNMLGGNQFGGMPLGLQQAHNMETNRLLCASQFPSPGLGVSTFVRVYVTQNSLAAPKKVDNEYRCYSILKVLTAQLFALLFTYTCYVLLS